jgi:hypothetical protein
MQTDITTFWLFIGAGVAVGAVFGAIILGFFVGSQSRRHPLKMDRRGVTSDEAEISLSDFRRELQLLRKKREIINVYSGDYFHTLQESGWDNLHRIVATLATAETQLAELFEQGRYEEAYQLSEFLLDRLSPEEANKVKSDFPALREVWYWRSESAGLVIELLRNLEVAAIQTQEAGVTRNRDRKPTLMAISDLQNLISK